MSVWYCPENNTITIYKGLGDHLIVPFLDKNGCYYTLKYFYIGEFE